MSGSARGGPSAGPPGGRPAGCAFRGEGATGSHGRGPVDEAMGGASLPCIGPPSSPVFPTCGPASAADASAPCGAASAAWAPAGGPGKVLGHRRQELARVGVRRAPQHFLQCAGLHDPAFAHDRHPVGDLRDHPEVVGDEEQAHAAPALELLHQAQDPGLHRHVQGGGRLVSDQQAGAAGDGHGDHHPLALAAGEAVGVLVHAQLRVLDPHLRQRLDRLAAGLLVAEARAGEPDRLDDLVADGEHRVQRGHGLLEDHRDVPAAHLHPLLLGQPQQVARRGVGPRVEAEQDLAVAALGEVRRQQADHRQGGDGLAATRFAHQAEGLPRLDVEARPVHRPHRLPVGPEPGMEVPHFEQRPRVPGRAGRGHGPGLPGVRRLRAALGVVSP